MDATAEKNRLTIAAVGDSTFRVSAPGLSPEQITRERWALPGLTIDVETDAAEMNVSAADGGLDVRYRKATKFILRTAQR